MEVRVLVGVQSARGTAETSTMYRLASTDFGMAPSVDKTTSEALGSLLTFFLTLLENQSQMLLIQQQT